MSIEVQPSMWPLMLQSRQPGKATVREALRQLVEISGRYA